MAPSVVEIDRFRGKESASTEIPRTSKFAVWKVLPRRQCWVISHSGFELFHTILLATLIWFFVLWVANLSNLSIFKFHRPPQQTEKLRVSENCSLLCYYAASSGSFSPAFRDNLTVPSSGVKSPCFWVCIPRLVLTFEYWCMARSAPTGLFIVTCSISWLPPTSEPRISLHTK